MGAGFGLMSKQAKQEQEQLCSAQLLALLLLGGNIVVVA